MTTFKAIIDTIARTLEEQKEWFFQEREQSNPQNQGKVAKKKAITKELNQRICDALKENVDQRFQVEFGDEPAEREEYKRLHPKPIRGVTKDVKDSVDIYAHLDDCFVLIETDATRADQVAKKMLSRFALFNGIKDAEGNAIPLIYIIVLYQGTKHMNESECVKYAAYGNHLLKELNPRSALAFLTMTKTVNTILEW